MLRASLRLSKTFGNGSAVARAGRHWQVLTVTSRSFADIKKPSIADSSPVVLPGSASDGTNEPAPQGPVATSSSSSLAGPPPLTPATPTTGTIPATNVPLTPPAPPATNATTAGSSDHLPSKPARKPRRIRRIFATLLLLSLAGFGGGVYYSRINDNFHDFFTEYVPFGEEAVLYFEEREFRKRFPPPVNRPRTKDTGEKITIRSQSGVTPRVAQEMTDATGKNQVRLEDAKQMPSQARPEDLVKVVEQAKKDALDELAPALPNTEPATSAATPVVKTPKEPASSSKMPEVDEPSRFPIELTRIDPINIDSANEPVVQDLVKIFNDIILVVNADNANDKFASTLLKAKDELNKVGGKVKSLKDEAVKEADEKVKASHEEFDRAAKELIRRLEGEMQEQEAQWKDEYEKERQKLQQAYEQKLKSEIERANEVNEQRLRNELLEQAVEMKRKFIAEVKERVEEERNARLGKLSDLSNTVNDLEKLTTDWNSVVDTNLKTQQLHVAVDAVRANLEKAQTPQPFVRELAALREIASDDPVVNAAIASINPTAYQRGIPSSAQLIDRFRRVAAEVRKAALLPEDAGVASLASSYVLSKLMFKKKGRADGDDVESILTRTETYLEEGNLDEAARETNSLQGWAKTLSRDWLSEVRKVLEVQQALDVIATEARLQSLRVE